MAMRLADIAIGILVPAGKPVVDVLKLISGEVEKLSAFKPTCTDLLDRLEMLFEELQRIERSGGLGSRAIEKYVKVLEEYWRQLNAYNDMNFFERLINYSKLPDAIARINRNIDELIQMVELVHARLTVEWQNKHQVDKAEHHHNLIEHAKNSAKVRDELRSTQDKIDAVVLLKDALQKMNNSELTLDDDVQAAVQRTLKAITFDAQELDDVTPPDWFINESEVDFDEVPFARGSFATVHHGTYQHAPVVVKMLLPGRGGLGTTLQAAFANEVTIWKRLNHPHVARLLGACHVSSRPFLVCDDATNGSMGDFLDRSADRQIMWRLLYEAAQGLSHLHSKKVIHGDIRLANILVTKAESALLTDFGLSRVKDKDKSISKSMTARKDGEPAVEGTWRWMAPEAFDFKSQFESDVYSLAMCILEAFVGLPPYADVMEEDQVKELILAGQLPTRPAGMSDKVWTLIERMTTKERKDRMPLEDVIKSLGEL
jgi:hypothetical protein